MQPDEYKHLAGRLALTRERLAEYLHDRVAVCEAEFAPETTPAFWPPPTTGWRRIEIGETWGHAWQYGWFRFRCEWPQEAAGEEPVLDLRLGGEGLVYTEDGHPLAAVTAYSVYVPSLEKRHIRLGRPVGAGPLVFYARVAAHFYNGLLVSPGETPHRAPMNYTEYRAVFTCAELARLNRPVQRYIRLLQHFEGLLKGENPDAPSFLARRRAGVVRQSLNRYAENPANLDEASLLLEEALRQPAEPWQPVACAVGHAHLDIAWLWPLDEGVQKAVRTFAEQLTNIERQPGYIFGASQPYLYEQVKAFAPALFERIRQAVRDGRWELQGAMYVEADSNCIGGESLARQFLYGKSFFQREFGVDVQTVWLPDSFGFSAVLPQIARQAGCFAMVTAKPFWASVQNKENCQKFPYSAFRWRGLRDDLLVNILPMCYYNGVLTPDMLDFAAATFTENDRLDRFLVSFGIGDGGGGPTEEMIERGRLVQNASGTPRVRFSAAVECLRHQARQLDDLPAWDGEIYLELHRGTLSNIARIKFLNRKIERDLLNLEALNAAFGGKLSPSDLEKLWKVLLINQFHDILPGSAIPSVYQHAFQELEAVSAKARAAARKIIEAATVQENDSLLLFNPTSLPHHEVLELPASGQDSPLPSFNEVTIPPFSTLVLHHRQELAAQSRPAEAPVFDADGLATLENATVRYRFDACGRLVSACRKADGFEFIPPGRPANILACHVDRPNKYDAWDIDCEYERMPPILPDVTPRARLLSPACQQLEVEYRWEHSAIRQHIRLAAHSDRLDFITEADWHENHRMLRVSFPLSIHFTEVRCDLGFGFLRRTALRNTTAQRNQFEFACQRYLACGDGPDRAALLNDCKYGANARDGALGLTLLRSARYPDELTDRGRHRFTYAFLPYDGTCGDAMLLQEALALNAPLMQFPDRAGDLVSPVQAVAIPGVTLETLKTAEDGSGDLVLRLVEQLGAHAAGSVEFARPVQATCVNLLEEGSGAPALSGAALPLAFAPFEIKTLRSRPASV